MTTWTAVDTSQTPGWGAVSTTQTPEWGDVNTNYGDSLLLQASTANLLLIQAATYDSLLLRPLQDWQSVTT